MFSAPAVLVEPKGMIADEVSPITPERFEWATQTPEPSPICLLKVPFNPAEASLCSFRNICSPVWEQMLTRIATHADVLGATEPSVRHCLIQTLCQPFFEQAVETLCRDISSVGPSMAEMTRQNITNGPLKDDRPILSLGQRLGLLEEDSTDADNDSAFATLFSSDGEDCEADQRMERSSQSSQFSSRLVGCDGDCEFARRDEKTQMVCKHWKSKGCCRYESQCKFSHPENKRGVSARGPTENSDVPLPNRSTRRRGGKN